MVVQEPVQAAIWHCLNHYAYEDAVFLAERLHAEVGSDEALFLLATCYYRAGRPINAYWLLQSKGCPTPQCKFLFARCCLDLERWSESETCLAGNVFNKNKSHDDIPTEFGDAAGFVYSMLGDLYSHTERFSKGIEYYKKSLKYNPFLWSCYLSLCDLGEKPDPNKIFQVSSLPNFSSCQSYCYPSVHTTNTSQPSEVASTTSEMSQESTPVANLPTPCPQGIMKEASNMASPDTSTTHEAGFNDSNMATPEAMTSINMVSRGASRTRPRVGRSLLGGTNSLSPLTPSFGILPLDTPSPGEGPTSYVTPSPTAIIDSQITAPKKTLPRRNQSATTTKPVFAQSGNSSNTTRDLPITMSQTPSPQLSNAPQQVLFAQGVRRSSRLFGSSNSVKENAAKKAPTKSKFSSPKAPTRKTKTRSSKTITSEQIDMSKSEGTPTVDNNSKSILQTPSVAQIQSYQKASVEGLMNLLRDIGKAYLMLSQYDCKKAIALFNHLPMHHYNTSWVLCQIGRSYFEIGDYAQAEKYFAEVRRNAPYHLEGMELYSTTLWHLQREVALSALAQELVEMDKESPEAWCATGNCFSLQKEHDTAIKFFQRAIQCNPNFAYAYTLLGHEYVLSEELERALACFRSAIRVDVRHYNAWYGVGMIYYKQEKFALAEMHYRKALSINPQSSALLCHIGVVQHALQKSEAALTTLDHALSNNPGDALCKFHKASILFATERYQEALNELEELKQIVPKESLVYFLLGKVYKKLGQTHVALMNFSWAMDLDPKGTNNQIKEAIDKRYLPDDDDGADTTLNGEPQSDNDGMADITAAVGQVAADVAADNEMEVEGDDMQLQANESDESL